MLQIRKNDGYLISLKALSIGKQVLIQAGIVKQRYIFHRKGLLFNESVSIVLKSVSIATNKKKGLIHYLENKVGVVDFANAQELVMFKAQGPGRACGL